MTTYNTGNPLGSASAKDLFDNAENLDVALNSNDDTFVDRRGNVRPTYKGAVDPTGLVQTAVNARDDALAARDAAIINSTMYPDEATGRAAVADGEYFKVIGSGDVAAREYRRTNATTSVLVAEYPSIDGVNALFKIGKNLFNYKTSTTGKVISASNGSISDSASNSLSDYIKVEPGQTYTRNYSSPGQVAFFDLFKNFISGINSRTFTTPENCVFVRINHPEKNKETWQLEKGTSTTYFEPYGNEFKQGIQRVRERAELGSVIEIFSDTKTISFGSSPVVHTAGKRFNRTYSEPLIIDYSGITLSTKILYFNTESRLFRVEDVNYIPDVNDVFIFQFSGSGKPVIRNYIGTTLEQVKVDGEPYLVDDPVVGTIKNRVEIKIDLDGADSLCERVTSVDDIDSFYPFNSIKLCNVKKTEWGATVITYSDEAGFTRDGSNGDVMVEIPKHYFRRYIKDGYEYVGVSGEQLDGYQVDPAFIENGKEINAVYVGAYDGYVDGDSKLRSITGVQATTGWSLTSFRTLAKNNGKGFGLLDGRTVLMLQRLFMAYFADRNVENVVGLGLVSFPWQSGEETKAIYSVSASNVITVDTRNRLRNFRVGMLVNVQADGAYGKLGSRRITNMVTTSEEYTEITFTGDPVDIVAGVTRIYSQTQESGMTDDIVGHTGMADKLGGFDGTEAVKWLHIENLWGNVWNYIDGIYVSDLICYVGENTDDYTSGAEFVDTYKPLSMMLPLQETNNQNAFEEANYYVRNLLLDKINPAYALPIELGNGSGRNAGYCDPFYTKETGAYIPAFGGGIDHIFRAGMFVWRFWYASSVAAPILCGARLMYKAI